MVKSLAVLFINSWLSNAVVLSPITTLLDLLHIEIVGCYHLILTHHVDLKNFCPTVWIALLSLLTLLLSDCKGYFFLCPFFWHRPICINLESTIANANNTVTAFSLFTIVGSSRGAVFSLISAISASYFLGNNCSFLSSFFSSRQIFN